MIKYTDFPSYMADSSAMSLHWKVCSCQYYRRLLTVDAVKMCNVAAQKIDRMRSIRTFFNTVLNIVMVIMVVLLLRPNNINGV